MKKINSIVLIVSLVFNMLSTLDAQTKLAPSQNPPGNLNPKEVPQFVVLGADDNALSGDASNDGNAMRWIVNFLNPLKNPAGTGDIRTFDGTPTRMSFYINSMYFSDTAEDNPYLLMKIINEAYNNGHEIGDHTHGHPHGQEFTVEQWEKEMSKCKTLLSNPLPSSPIENNTDCKYGPGIPADKIVGFRTPYLEYENNTIRAANNLNFLYDCSIEEGYEDNQDGTNNFWPYTLDNGSPGHEVLKKDGQKKTSVGKYPGMWEMPAYCIIAPPDDKCESYGIIKGLRKRMSTKMDLFDSINGKITGFDYNLWTEYELTYKEVLAILKYTFDLHYNGNRSPMLFGMHSQFYSEPYKNEFPKATVREAQMAIEEFIKYTLTKPETRVVPTISVLEWCKNPVPLHVNK